MGKAQETKKLDKVLSEYVRRSNADSAGYVSCFTCSVKIPFRNADCGHFITRSKKATRWLYKPSEGLTNVQPQCKKCNGFLGGQQYIFAKRLDAVYGEGTAEKILQMSNKTFDMSLDEMVQLRKYFQDKLKLL